MRSSPHARARSLHTALLLTIFGLTFFQPNELAFAEKESHFIEVWRTTRALPIGTNLGAVTQFVQKKIVLKRDVPGAPIRREGIEEASSLFLARALPASSYLVEGAVVSGVPSTLSSLVPPTQTLLTFVQDSESLPELSLCTPYEQASLELFRSGKKIYQLRNNMRVVSFELTPVQPEPVQDERVQLETQTKNAASKGSGIVVIAVREDEAEKMNSLGTTKDIEIRIHCLSPQKYE